MVLGHRDLATLSDQPNPPRTIQLGMKLKW